MKVTDEIDKIKKEGIENLEYNTDGSLNIKKAPFESVQNTPGRDTSTETFWNEPTHVGGYYPEEFGESKYDSNIPNWRSLQGDRSLEDFRAEYQPFFSQIGNNFLNAGTIAATTFADSFIGTAAGLVHMWTDSEGDDPNLSVAERRLNSFVQNPVSLWLNSINKAVKEAAPTYTSDKYRENRENGEWYKNIFTSEFMGETVLENSGFMLGMVLSGKLSGSMINKVAGSASKLNIVEKGVKNAIKAGKFTGTVEEGLAKALTGKLPIGTMDKALMASAKSLRNINTTNKIVSTALATTGEARLEGIHSAEEFSEEHKAALESQEGQQELLSKTLNQLYERNPEIFVANPAENDPLQSIHPDYIKDVEAKFKENQVAAMEAIDTASKRIAAFDFAVNYPALLASNAIQFSKSFGGNYGRQKGFRKSIKSALHGNSSTAMEGVERVTGEAGKMTVKKLPWYKKVGRVMTNPITEANEEMMQAAGQASANIYAESLMSLQFDPDAELESLSILDAIVKGTIETYTDIKSYEEGFSGFLMGAFGSPNITLSKNARGKTNIFDGGIWGDIKDVQHETQGLQEAVDAMNARVNSPEFQKMYKAGHARRILDNLKEGALDNGDEVAYNNMDHTQFIQDMLLYEDLGKLGEFRDMIESNIETYGTEDIAEIEELAEELKALGTNQETGVSMYKEGELAQDIVKETLEHNKDLLANMDKYAETSKNLRDLLGGRFEGDKEMSEMILLMSHAERIDADYDKSINSLKETLQKASKHSNDLTKFPILLQGVQQELTFAEILDSATPMELNEWLIGTNRADISGAKELSYVQMLLSSAPQLNAHQQNLVETIKKLSQPNTEGLTQEQQLEQIAQMNQSLKMVESMNDALRNTPYRSEIFKEFNKIVALEGTRAELVNTYNRYAGEPHLLTEKMAEQEVKAQDKREGMQNEDFTNKVKEAKTVQEVREAVEEQRITHGKVPQSVLNNLGTKNSKEFSSIVAEYNRIESMESDIASSPKFTSKSDWIKNGVMQLWNIAKKRATTVAEAYTPTILADDLNELVGESGEAITQEDREAIRDAFVETMADLQGKESKTASIIPTPKTPETVDTPTPEVAEFGGDSKDTGRKRGKPTSAAERRKAAKEVQDAGDLGTPVNSIELFPAKGAEASKEGVQSSKDNPVVQEVVTDPDDAFLISVTSDGHTVHGKHKDWSKKEQDIRKEPDGWHVYKGIPYYKNSYESGRPNDNLTIWFKTMPSESQKKVIEGVEGRTSSIKEMQDTILDLINEGVNESKAESQQEAAQAKKADIERRRQEELNKLQPTSEQELIATVNNIFEKNRKLPWKHRGKDYIVNRLVGQSPLTDALPKEDAQKVKSAVFRLREGIYGVSETDINEINAKYDAEIAALDIVESPTTNASKSKGSTQATHIPLAPTTQGLDNSKALDNSIAEENKATANKETAWTPGTFEIDIDEYRANKQFKDNGNSPRSSIFKKAVEFLKDKGAWNYINSGKVKANDKITLLASQEYWDHLDSDNNRGYGNNAKPLLWAKKVTGSEINDNTIEHKGSHYQILGTFTTNDNPSLHAKVTNGYDGSQRTHIDSDISTTIKEVQFGRIAVSEGKQNSLNDIVQTTPWGESAPLRLGVSLGGGNIDTNGSSVSVMPISGDLNDAGRLYILVPGANGRHRPMALGSRTVAEMQKNKFFEMNDPNNTFFAAFNKALDRIAESFKIEDVDARSKAFNASIGYLMNFVHVGKESNIGIHLNESSDFTDIKIQNRETGRTVRFEVGTAELANTETYQAEATVLKEMILNALGETGTYFQINKNNINGSWSVTGESYNEALKKSGILYSDIDANHVRGANFTMNPIDNNLKEITPKAPVKPTPTPITSNRVSEGISVTYNNSLYTIEASGDVLDANKNKVTDAKTVGFVKIQHLVDKMSPTEKAENQVDFGSLNTNSLTTTAKTGWVVTNSKGTKYLWDGSKLITDKALVSKAVALVESRKVPASVQIDNWFHGEASSTTKQIPNNITEITEFEGTKIEYVESIKSKDGVRHVGAQNIGKGEKIRVDLKKMREIYDNKSWATTVNSDPLHQDAFKSFEEFMMFTFLHEKAHESISIDLGESNKEYETRINNEAMRRMESDYGIVMPKLDSNTITESIDFDTTTKTPTPAPVRKGAKRGGMQVNTAVSVNKASNASEGSGIKINTPAEVQEKINENKEFHRRNCNSIKPR